jgi:steroid 5-alpha reductase family enzyme
MFVLCAAGFVESWQWVACISPVFVFTLLYFGSGVALSEQGAEKRYGARPDFQEYKSRTSKFVPWFPKRLPVSQNVEA